MASPSQAQSKQSPRIRVRDTNGNPVKGLYTRDGSYVAGFNVNGVWKTQVLRDASCLTEARKMRASLIAKFDSGEAVTPSRVKLADVWQDFYESFDALVASGDRSARTLALYKQRWNSHIDKRLGKKPVQSIKASDISALLAHLREEKKASWTVNGVFVVLSSILTHAMTRGFISESPVRRLAKSEKPRPRNKTEARVLTPDEVEALVASAPKLYKAAVATLAYTGMRASEVLGLTWEDINYEAQEINVRFQLSRASVTMRAERIPLKTDGSRRDIVLLPRLGEILKEHQKGSPDEPVFVLRRPSDFVFQTGTGGPIGYHNLQQRGVRKAAEAAGLDRDGLPRLSCHSMRHTYASFLIRSGLDVYSVSRQLGHSKASTTLDKYAAEFEKARNSEVIRDRLQAAFGGN